MRPDRAPDPDREAAADLAASRLDALCDDYRFGKPSPTDVIAFAVRVMREVKNETGVSLFMRHDPATGVTFS